MFGRPGVGACTQGQWGPVTYGGIARPTSQVFVGPRCCQILSDVFASQLGLVMDPDVQSTKHVVDHSAAGWPVLPRAPLTALIPF